MNEPGPIELPNGVRFGCDCKTCNEIRDREIAADDERRKLGPLPPAPAVERHLVGLAHHPTIWEVAGPVVATLPTGERVELPAGTVLREAPTPIQLANAEEERAILPRATRVEVRSRAGSQPIVTVEDDAGRTIRLVRVGAAEAMRHGDPPDEPKTLGEQLHDEHDRAAHADGSPCLCDPATTVLADLTERAGLPREMAPSVGPACGCDLPGLACPIHGAPSPDPWLAGLTLAAYNATRAGLDRGTSAKAGVAALMSAYTAGVERAIADHAKART